MLTQEAFIKSHLLTYLWRFRKVEGLSGMTGIGCVLRNRVLSGWFAGDWLSVIKDTVERSQFANIEFPDMRDPLFARLVWKVESIFDNTIDDITNGGKYWTVLAEATEEFKKTIIQHPEDHPRLSNVGGIYFFG